MNYDYCVKVILIGDMAVGKTSLMNVLLGNDFQYSYNATIGVDFGVKSYEHEDKIYKLQIWDTAGQEKFISIIHSYFANVCCAIFVFDITNKDSFNNIPKWIEEVDQYSKREPIKLLIANKIDLPNHEVTPKDIGELLDTYNLLYLNTSAKNKENIDQIYKILVETLDNKILSGKIVPNENLSITTSKRKTYFTIEENVKPKKCCIIS